MTITKRLRVRLVLGVAVTLAWMAPVAMAQSAAAAGPGQTPPERADPDGGPPDPARPGRTGQTAGEDGTQQTDLAELERRIAILAEEVERLRSGDEPQVELTEARTRALGLAPSAATAYGRSEGVSLAGYGEMLYENFASASRPGRPARAHGGAQIDFLRAILYAGYRFNDRFLFNSEIELEHADEISVEFAYIDYRATDHVGFRGGMLLVPMGLVNEFHEPTVFLGAERPVTEQRIIPSTWRENGGGVYGSTDRFAFRAYVINGLEATGFSANGIRGGRQKGSKAKATDLAFVGRLDVTPTPGAFVGASLYSGGSGQGEIVADGRTLDVQTTIVDLHGQLRVRGLDLRGLYARATIDDAADLNRVLGLRDAAGVAGTLQGGYVQLGYDLLAQTGPPGGPSLTPYIRLERVDTQAALPNGFQRSPSTDNRFTTLGVELKPIPNIVVKIDHAWVSNDARTGVNQFNIALGYAF